MTTLTLGEAAAKALGRVARTRPAHDGGWRRIAAPHRTAAPVRRDSIEAGTFEDMFFASPAKGECDRLLRAARVALDAGRRLRRTARASQRELSAPERAMAALTAGAVRVYEEICTLARLNHGRVFPSYDRLAQTTALGRATIARALTLLEAAGFLVRQRRFRRVEGAGPGPRYKQTSNAYRPVLPRQLLDFLPRAFRSAPIPDDATQHVAAQAEELAAMQAQLSCREFAQATVDGVLGQALARLGAALDGHHRESQNRTESLPDSLDKDRYGFGLTDRRIHPKERVQKRDNDLKRYVQKPRHGAPATPTQCSRWAQMFCVAHSSLDPLAATDGAKRC